MRLFGGIVATVVLTFLALKLWIEGNDDLCSGQDTLRCSDGVHQAAGVALWVLLAVLVVLTVLAVTRPDDGSASNDVSGNSRSVASA